MLQEYEFGFGGGTLHVKLPQEQVLNVVEGQSVSPLADVAAAVRAAVRQPIGTPPLRQVVHKGDKVAVVASDVTRAWIHFEQLLPPLLDELNDAGVPDEDITLVVALGAHRLHTDQDNLQVYGREVVNRVKIIQSQAQRSEDFAYVGTTTRGVKVYLNKHVLAADKVILTGGIVYHLMAGFGGGRKSVLPGIAGYDTIQGNHSFCLHAEVGKGISAACVSGKLTGNDMHDDMMEMAAMLNPTFLVNAVFTPEGQFARIVAGHWDKAWREGCKTVEKIFGVPISGLADVVIASAGGYPKDINLYQGSKTVDNAFMALKPGGVNIVALECREIAEPPDFSGWFDYENLYDRELALRRGFTVPGFIALKFGYMFRQATHILVTLPQNKAFVEKTGMMYAASLDEALALAEKKLGRRDYSINVMSHGANTVPLLPA